MPFAFADEENAIPFARADDAVAAAQGLVGGKFNLIQRKRVEARLRASWQFAEKFIPILSDQLHLQAVNERHDFLNQFEALLDRGVNLSGAADQLARQMTDANFGIRAKAARLLIRMGSTAAAATARAQGMLRSPIEDVRENALNLLAAIGESVTSLPKITQLLRSSQPSAVRLAAVNAVKVLCGEMAAADYLPIAKIKASVWQITILALGGTPAWAERLSGLFPAPQFAVEFFPDLAAAAEFFAQPLPAAVALIDATDLTCVATLENLRRRSGYDQAPVLLHSPEPARQIIFATAKFRVARFLSDDCADEELQKAVADVLPPERRRFI
ncbi:hypothetical protein AGMMS49959_00940 [Planctomycetales bacterium]|nr:hypothetical protein AGMMS49959_00940 [Planctomycetales bacterium]